MTGLVDRLEEQGYLRREAHPSDRRATVLRLTRKGETAFQREARVLSRARRPDAVGARRGCEDAGARRPRLPRPQRRRCRLAAREHAIVDGHIRITRRGLLQAGLVGSAVVWAGGLIGCAAPGRAATGTARSARGALAVGRGDPAGGDPRGARVRCCPAPAPAREQALDAGVAALDDYLASLPLPLQDEARDVFETLDLLPVRVLLLGTWQRWQEASPADDRGVPALRAPEPRRSAAAHLRVPAIHGGARLVRPAGRLARDRLPGSADRPVRTQPSAGASRERPRDPRRERARARPRARGRRRHRRHRERAARSAPRSWRARDCASSSSKRAPTATPRATSRCASCRAFARSTRRRRAPDADGAHRASCRAAPSAAPPRSTGRAASARRSRRCSYWRDVARHRGARGPRSWRRGSRASSGASTSSRGTRPTPTTRCSRAAQPRSAGRYGAIRRNVHGCAQPRLLRARLSDRRQAEHGRHGDPRRPRSRRGARHARARRAARVRRRPRHRSRRRRARRARRAADRPARVAAGAVGGGGGRRHREPGAADALAAFPIRTGSLGKRTFLQTHNYSLALHARARSTPSTARRSRSTPTSSPGATASPVAPASTWRPRARSPSSA